jgi:hypothetical protein
VEVLATTTVDSDASLTRTTENPPNATIVPCPASWDSWPGASPSRRARYGSSTSRVFSPATHEATQSQMTARALSIALLVVLAGCGGLGASGTASPSPDAGSPATTDTPSPTPSPTATDAGGSTDGSGPTDAGDYPPGVGADGVTNVSALVSAHRAALADVAYVYRSNRTLDSPALPGVEGIVNYRVRAGPAKTPGYLYYNQSGRLTQDRIVEFWQNDSQSLARVVTAAGDGTDRVRYAAEPEPRRPGRYELPALLPSLLRGSYAVETADRDGVVLRAEGPGSLASQNFSRLEGTVSVDARGRIRSADLRGTIDDPSGNLSLDIDYRLGLVDEVDPPHPTWSRFAVVAPPAVSATPEDPGVVRVENTGDVAFPNGTRLVRIVDGRPTGVVVLPEPLAPGETVYLYRPADGGPVSASPSQPPATDIEPFRRAGSVGFTDPRGEVLLQVSVTSGSASVSRPGSESGSDSDAGGR